MMLSYWSSYLFTQNFRRSRHLSQKNLDNMKNN